MCPAFIVQRVILTDNSTWKTKQEQKSYQSTSATYNTET